MSVEILYHYCSLDTFFKIISTHTLRMSDIAKSNDSLELIAFEDGLKEKIREVYTKYIDDSLEKTRLLEDNPKEALSYIKEREERSKEFQNFLSLLNIGKLQTLKSWSICFSEDGDLLSQWRGYADDAKGISIGFTKKYFDNLNLYISADPTLHMRLGKVSYSKEEIIKILNEKTELNSIKSDSSAEDIFDILTSTLTVASKECPFYKKASFSEEKEWRLAISDLFPTDMAKSNYLKALQSSNNIIFPIEIKDWNFITKNDLLVSYIEIYLHNIKNAISKIIIGPKSKCTIRDIKQFLIFHGLLDNLDDNSIEVIKSESSYR